MLSITQVSASTFLCKHGGNRHDSSWEMDEVKQIIVVMNSAKLFKIFVFESTVVLTRRNKNVNSSLTPLVIKVFPPGVESPVQIINTFVVLYQKRINAFR